MNYKTPGIPRTPDGKPNLTAAAPRTADGKPDFSGLWRPGPNAGAEIAKTWSSIKAQPWAQGIADRRHDEFGKDNPLILCLPLGPQIDLPIRKVIHAPNIITLLNEDLTYRQIFMDGRGLEADPNPIWMGYSVGHWDKDVLVIESNGFNDRSWIGGGYPHSESLRMTERLRRIDFGHMELQRTLTDPKALVEPLTITLPLELDADTEMLEYVCNENEKDRQHIVGKVSDFARSEVAVAPEILARYAGAYVFGPSQRNALGSTVQISLENGRLMFESSVGKRPMTALSETRFATQFGYVAFATDASSLTATIPEGDFQAGTTALTQLAKEPPRIALQQLRHRPRHQRDNQSIIAARFQLATDRRPASRSKQHRAILVCPPISCWRCPNRSGCGSNLVAVCSDLSVTFTTTRLQGSNSTIPGITPRVVHNGYRLDHS